MDLIERTAFGRRLFEAREAAKLTQQDVAKRVGMSQGTLAEAETSGKRSGFTPQLAEVYKVSAKWLATGKGEREIGAEQKLPPAVEVLKPKSAHESRIDEIVTLLRGTSMEGLAVILDRAKDAARDYPLAKQTRAS
jgi:transcriptional regulator with XRE-family HTH domain